MNNKKLIERIKQLTEPLAPIPSDHAIELKKLENIRCVAFDFYGTMFISGVGDIGVDEDQKSISQASFREALTDSGFEILGEDAGITGTHIFQEVITEHISERKEHGIEYPEPDIVDVWLDVLTGLRKKSLVKGELTRDTATRFAIEFEFRVNAIWPVPNLTNVLEKLKKHDFDMGIISNSQFYTPLALQAITGKPPEALGFDEQLMNWSYVSGLKKPSVSFYKLFVNALQTKDYGPGQVLYVGNDVRKDIRTAKYLGMKTALFVGDKRSIRHSEEDLSKEEFQPDLIVNDLQQLIECLL